MIDLAILGLLRDHDLHGYELKKQLGDLMGRRSPVSFGSLYPALARLEGAGAVRVVQEVETDLPMPMTGALSGEVAAFHTRRPRTRGRRGRKVYAITADGRDRLLQLLTEPDADDDRLFALKVAFCRHLPSDERLQLFERRRRNLQDRVDRRSPHADGDRYLRSLRERDSRSLDHDLAWLDRLIDEERSAPDAENTHRTAT